MTISKDEKVTIRALKQFIFTDDKNEYRYVYVDEELEINYNKAYKLYNNGFVDVLNPLFNDGVIQTKGYNLFLNLLKKKEGAL